MQIKRKKEKLRGLLHTHNDVVLRWLGNTGATGTLSDALLTYFQSQSGLTSGTLYDHMNNALTTLGYVGTLSDKLNAFYIQKTGIAYAPDAARQFWNDLTLTFGINTNYLLDSDGNTLLDSNGNPITEN